MKRLIITIFALLIIVFSGSFVYREIAVAPIIDDSDLSVPLEGSPLADEGSLAESSADADSIDNDGDADSVDNDEIYASDIEGDGDDIDDDDIEDDEPEEPPVELVSITISAAGDTTLGGDPRGARMFIREFELHGSDHSHFLANVRHIFEEDDLTIVNLEGTLTDATAHLDKTFVLRAPPHYAKILSSSGVDAVTLANNHSKDFLERGYQDTLASLEEEGIAYFGDGINTILEINGIRVGLFGLAIWVGGTNSDRLISKAVDDLRERGAQLIIAYYHWGTELSNTPAKHQRTLGHFSIDNGVDLVLGSHPHVLQGIEEYNGKYIVYSLGNFSFGANNNPADHDSLIFQQTFIFEDGSLLDTRDINIIPVLISSEKGRNNFQPIIAEGEDAERIMERIGKYSDLLNDP